MPTPTPYKKLGSNARTLGGRQSLHLGPDHLLYVNHAGFVENYKRFFFADIQSFVLSESNRQNLYYLWLGFATVGAIIVAAFVGSLVSLPAGFTTLGILLGILLLLFAGNALLGPTCVCSISTAVQTEILLPLRRTRSARLVLDQVAEFVRNAQAPTEAAPAVTPVASPISTGGGTTAGRPALRPSLPPPPRHEKGTWHIVLFMMLLLQGALSAADMAITSLAVTVAASLQGLVIVLAAVAAVLRQRDSDLSKGVRTLVWWTFGYLVVMFSFGYGYLLLQAISTAEFQPNEWKWIKMMAATSPWDSPLLLAGFLVEIAASVTLGTLGLLAVRKHVRTFARATALASVPEPPPAPPLS